MKIQRLISFFSAAIQNLFLSKHHDLFNHPPPTIIWVIANFCYYKQHFTLNVHFYMHTDINVYTYTQVYV